MIAPEQVEAEYQNWSNVHSALDRIKGRLARSERHNALLRKALMVQAGVIAILLGVIAWRWI